MVAESFTKRQVHLSDLIADRKRLDAKVAAFKRAEIIYEVGSWRVRQVAPRKYNLEFHMSCWQPLITCGRAKAIRLANERHVKEVARDRWRTHTISATE